ncbi:MAG: hypothetical protein OQJ97_17685 [Rhodospirillales bacterium]|nr:hypothetical protein [Rhodospirillales bacterium]
MKNWTPISAGNALQAFGLLLAIISGIWAIRPLGYGIWYQSEPVSIALHGCAAICALGLLISNSFDKNRVHFHFFAVIPILIAGLSLLMIPFVSHTGGTILGSPELGQGVLWFIEFSIFFLVAQHLFSSSNLEKNLLVGACLFITAGLTILTMLSSAQIVHFIPYFFPDYLAFLSVFTGAMAFSIWRGKFIILTIVTIICGVTIVVSANKGAFGLTFIVIPAAYFFFKILKSNQLKRKLKITFAIALPLAVMIFINGIGGLLLVEPPTENDSELDSAIYSFWATANSRYNLTTTALKSVQNPPSAMLSGQGWGSFGDQLAINLPINKFEVRDDIEIEDQLNSASNWDAVWRVDFHSHSYITEALVSLGIPGLIFITLMWGAPAIWPAEGRSLVAAISSGVGAGIAALWFQLPLSLPFFAIAWAALIRRDGPTILSIEWLNKTHIKSLFFVSMSIMFTAVTIYNANFTKNAYRFQPAMIEEQALSKDEITCLTYFNDFGRGGIHLAHRLRTFTKVIVAKSNEETEISDVLVQRLRGLTCASEAYANTNPSFRLLSATVLAKSDLAFSNYPPKLDAFINNYLSNWRLRVDQVLAMAPGRTDLTAMYLLWEVKNERYESVSSLTTQILGQNPNDPIGLWFSGIAMIGDPDKVQAGLDNMRLALEKGVERFIPIEPEVKASLLY